MAKLQKLCSVSRRSNNKDLLHWLFHHSQDLPRGKRSSLLLLILTHSVSASILHPFLLIQPSPGEAESSKLLSHLPLHPVGSQLYGSKSRTIQQNSCAFAKSARSVVFIIFGPCWCLGACCSSVPSLSLMESVSSSGRCWNMSMVKAMAAEEDQEHAAIFQFGKTSRKQELAVSVQPCACRHQTEPSTLSYWLNWAEVEGKTRNWPSKTLDTITNIQVPSTTD